MTSAPDRTAIGGDELRRLAELATPGPWEARTFLVKGGAGLKDTIVHVGTSTSLGPSRSHESVANAAWIAAVSPDVILSLLDRLERAEAALSWYGEQARLCRLVHSEGDAGRHALDDDGGKRARAALSSSERSTS